jgi:choice-of-anchor A domain-containing protein
MQETHHPQRRKIMKPFISLQGRALRSCLVLLTAALLLPAAPSKAATWGNTDADFFSEFGFTQDWTVLDLGTNPVSLTSTNVSGDFGVAGSTTLTTSGVSLDNLYLNSNATIHKSFSSTGIQKTITTNLNPDITAATNATNYFKSLPDSSTSTWTSSNSSLSNKLELGPTNGSLNLSHNSLLLTATSTTPVVFNISTFSLSNGNLTLSGSANDEFVFNIYGGTMSISSASINLTGGLTPSDVIFNYVGTAGSGPAMAKGSSVSGIILASQQTVTIANSNVTGAVISNGLKVTNASIESPDN